VAAGGGLGDRGACKRGQRRGEIGPGPGESDAWRPTKQEVERQRRQSGGWGSCTAPAAEGGRAGEQKMPEEEEGKGGPGGLFGNFKNLRDLSVK
jgi:hypothetical protein